MNVLDRKHRSVKYLREGIHDCPRCCVPFHCLSRSVLEHGVPNVLETSRPRLRRHRHDHILNDPGLRLPSKWVRPRFAVEGRAKKQGGNAAGGNRDNIMSVDLSSASVACRGIPLPSKDANSAAVAPVRLPAKVLFFAGGLILEVGPHIAPTSIQQHGPARKSDVSHDIPASVAPGPSIKLSSIRNATCKHLESSFTSSSRPPPGHVSRETFCHVQTPSNSSSARPPLHKAAL
jgi:hypothetical protein